MYGGVSPVKDQASCGSCWTFSTTGALESRLLIKYGQFRNMSEQQLVDCAGDYENMGCNGGLPSHAFQYIHDNNMTTDDVYPYTAKDGACVYDPKTASISIPFPGSVNITIGDEVELMQALFSVGPVAISF